ncbi:MAG: hypothetical protein ABIS20_24020 [Thermoanaerobaculia bacterium]
MRSPRRAVGSFTVRVGVRATAGRPYNLRRKVYVGRTTRGQFAKMLSQAISCN